MNLKPILELRAVERRPPHKGSGIDLQLAPGQVLALLGPANSGKAELTQVIAGITKSYRGQVLIDGSNVVGSQHMVGYCPRLPGVFPEMTCSEYLSFFADSFQIPTHYRPSLVREALRRVELHHSSDRKARELSPLDQQRLNLARATVHNPSLIVVQDVLGQFDKAERQILVDVLQRIRQMGKAMVIVACSWNQIAAISSHLCVMVSDGVLGFGEVSEIKPILSSLTMNQVLFGGGGFANSIRFLDAHPHVYHLSVSTDQQRLVRFIYDARQQPFPELLETMKNQGASIVSVGEDRSFPGLSEQY